MSTYEPRTHIINPRFQSITLCGRLSAESKCGEPRSDTTPPAVFIPETGSVRALSGVTCLGKWLRAREKPTAT
jgi:hypothetical protein